MCGVQTGELTCPDRAYGPGGESLVWHGEETGSREVGVGYGLWGREGDTAPVPSVPRPCGRGEGIAGPRLLTLSTMPSPGTHALWSVDLNECGFAVVELGFGATCDVS